MRAAISLSLCGLLDRGGLLGSRPLSCTDRCGPRRCVLAWRRTGHRGTPRSISTAAALLCGGMGSAAEQGVSVFRPGDGQNRHTGYTGSVQWPTGARVVAGYRAATDQWWVYYTDSHWHRTLYTVHSNTRLRRHCHRKCARKQPRATLLGRGSNISCV